MNRCRARVFNRLILVLVVVLFGADARTLFGKTAIGVLMPWYGNGDEDGWLNWGEMGHDPERVIDGKRDIASVRYPIMGPYKSRQDTTESWHLAFAQAMGLDVLLIDYYTPNLPGKRVLYDFTVSMLDKAASGDIKIAVQYEPKIHTQNWVRNYNGDRTAMVEAVKQDLRHIHDVLAAKPAYWRVDDKPVVQVFGQAWTLTPSEWADVVATLNSENRLLYYMGDSVSGGDLANWYPCFQSQLNWSLDHPDISGAQGWNANYAFAWNVNDLTRRWALAATGRKAAGTAWPGFDDSGVNGWGITKPRFVDRADGEFYRATLAVLDDQAHDWRVFITLNDWNEGTELEPSYELGYRYAVQTQNHIEAWKGVGIDDELPQDVTEQHFPSLVTIWDGAENRQALHAYEAVAIDNANAHEFAGDTARYFREGRMTPSYIQYQLTDPVRGFRVPAWFVASDEIKDFRFFTSPDGADWTEHSPVVVNKGGGNWIKVFYKNSRDLPAGHKFLRIQWQTSTGQWWSPQIGEVKVY